ncbi:cation diffusion facilitator family transporter [Chloroflexota bacterium]
MVQSYREAPRNPVRSEVDDRQIRRVTWIGLIINLLLAAFKFTAGIIGSSQVIVADAVHSLTDCTTDIAVLVGSRYWSRPPDEGHPHGHRRIETLVTIFIGSALLIAAIEIAWDSINTLHEKHSSPPGWIAFAAAGVSIVIKEALYRWTTLVGKRVKSPALLANAWHHRLDAISSVPALLAVGGAILFSTWAFLDHVGAIVVSILIMQAAIKIIWPGIREFTDAGAPKHICEQIKNIARKEDAVQQVHAIRTRYIGTSLQVDLHIIVDGSMSVLEGHDVAGAVKNRILSEGPDVIDVLVHIEPSETAIPEEECL